MTVQLFAGRPAAGAGASPGMAQAAGEEISCPNWRIPPIRLQKAGRLGFSDCYRTFAEGLEGLLKTMHKGPSMSERRQWH